MRIAVERPESVERSEHEAEDDLADPVPGLLARGRASPTNDARGQLGGEHASRRVAVEHRRDPDERVIAVVVGEQLLVGRLELVVDFVGEADLDLVDHLRRVEPAEALLEQRAEHVGVAQVGRDRLADAGVLHLDGDRPLAPVARRARSHGGPGRSRRRRSARRRTRRTARRSAARAPTRRSTVPARSTSAERPIGAGRAPAEVVRAGRRRGSWPSGRASSARPSSGRVRRRPAPLCGTPVHGPARRVARPMRRSCGRRSSRTCHRPGRPSAPGGRCDPTRRCRVARRRRGPRAAQRRVRRVRRAPIADGCEP